MKRLSLQARLLGALATIVALGLLGLSWFAFSTVDERRQAAADAGGAKAAVEFSVATGQLVHQLQEERGASVGFIAARGQSFGSEMTSAQRATDEALGHFEALLASRGGSIDSQARALAERAVSTLAGLSSVRQQASDADGTSDDIAAYFTSVIGDLLVGIETSLAGAEDPTLVRQGVAYVALLNSKEQSGRTRAALAAAFQADEFSAESLATVTSQMGKSEGFITTFIGAASETMEAAYRQRANSAGSMAAAAFEQQALDRALVGGFGIEPAEWLAAATTRQDLLREVVVLQAEELAARASDRAAWADREVRNAVVVSLLIMVIMLGFGGYLTRWVKQNVTAPLLRNAAVLASTSADLSAVSTQISANSEETTAQAGVVAAAGEQVSQSVQTVATAVEEMSSAVREISDSAAEASRVASAAVDSVVSTNASVSRLQESSDEIGKIVEVITSIAEQTNLLALNATIESARAGAAGKGFAVVANEVKELARQTAEATELIASRINATQADSVAAVAAMAEISDVITRIADMQNTIASAVEEQTATNNEIARSVNEAARGAQEIAENISSVADAARDTSEGVARAHESAQELTTVSDLLRALVEGEAVAAGV